MPNNDDTEYTTIDAAQEARESLRDAQEFVQDLGIPFGIPDSYREESERISQRQTTSYEIYRRDYERLLRESPPILKKLWYKEKKVVCHCKSAVVCDECRKDFKKVVEF